MTFTQIKTCQAANATTVFSRVIITTAFHKSVRKTALTRQTLYKLCVLSLTLFIAINVTRVQGCLCLLATELK